MRAWTMRILGILNLLGVAGGFWFLTGMLRMHWKRWPASASGGDWAIFWLLLGVNLYLAGHLAYCSVRMIREDESALLPAFLLQSAQILSVILDVIIFWLILPTSMGDITFGLWSVALSGIDLQVFYGVAPLGFLVLLILLCYRRKKPSMAQADGARP